MALKLKRNIWKPRSILGLAVHTKDTNTSIVKPLGTKLKGVFYNKIIISVHPYNKLYKIMGLKVKK
jgi:hypothetical protein